MKWTEETYFGKKLFFDKVCVAGINRTMCGNEKEKWSAYCLLPGIKERLGLFSEIKDAQSLVEKAILIWFAKTGLSEPTNVK